MLLNGIARQFLPYNRLSLYKVIVGFKLIDRAKPIRRRRYGQKQIFYPS